MYVGREELGSIRITSSREALPGVAVAQCTEGVYCYRIFFLMFNPLDDCRIANYFITMHWRSFKLVISDVGLWKSNINVTVVGSV